MLLFDIQTVILCIQLKGSDIAKYAYISSKIRR